MSLSYKKLGLVFNENIKVEIVIDTISLAIYFLTSATNTSNYDLCMFICLCIVFIHFNICFISYEGNI